MGTAHELDDQPVREAQEVQNVSHSATMMEVQNGRKDEFSMSNDLNLHGHFPHWREIAARLKAVL